MPGQILLFTYSEHHEAPSPRKQRYINTKSPHLTQCITLTHVVWTLCTAELHTVKFCTFLGQYTVYCIYTYIYIYVCLCVCVCVCVYTYIHILYNIHSYFY